MDKRLAEWFASGDTGSSSKCIALWLSAKVKEDKWWGRITPADPSDLGRCLRLLERIPEWKSRIPEMAEVNGEWAVFVERWDEMANSMIDEVGIDWSKGDKAPKTYNLMKNVEAQARSRAGTDKNYTKFGDAEIRFGS